MQWIRANRYTALLITMAVLVVTGGVMANPPEAGPPPEENNTGTGLERGGIENVAVEYPYYAPAVAESGKTAPRGSVQNPLPDAGSSAPVVLRFGNTKPKENTPLQTAPPVIPKVVQSAPAKTESPSLNDSYLSFFQTLSRMLAPADTRTPEQKGLYNYGNTLGSVIRDFENTHTDVVRTLKTFFDSRTDPSKAAAIPKIAGAYAQLTAGSPANPAVSAAQAGANLQIAADDYARLSAAVGSLQNIPPEAEILNTKLAKGYADVAQGLSRLIKAEGDAPLLEAINAYNANADEFIKNYVALVQLFSAYGVKFTENDAGAIFSFSATGGL